MTTDHVQIDSCHENVGLGPGQFPFWPLFSSAIRHYRRSPDNCVGKNKEANIGVGKHLVRGWSSE